MLGSKAGVHLFVSGEKVEWCDFWFSVTLMSVPGGWVLGPSVGYLLIVLL